MDDCSIIRVDQVSKQYGKHQAIKQVTFQVKQGEWFGIIGTSGAGKTTLLDLMLGHSHPDEGSLSVLGWNIKEDAEKLREYMNPSMQYSMLFKGKTVREVLHIFQSFYRKHCEVDDVLEQCGLLPYADRLVKRLNGGWRQRFSLAIAIINDPEVIILDEPTSGLDSQAKRDYWSIISAIHQQGKTIVMASHDMGAIQNYCNRVAVLKEGSLMTCDHPTTLIKTLPLGGLTMEAVYVHYAVGSQWEVEV